MPRMQFQVSCSPNLLPFLLLVRNGGGQLVSDDNFDVEKINERIHNAANATVEPDVALPTIDSRYKETTTLRKSFLS
eukprot:Gb_21873 [translate_table: standard]